LFWNQQIINKRKAVPVHASYVPLKPEAGCLQSDFYRRWHFICTVHMCFGGYTHWNTICYYGKK